MKIELPWTANTVCRVVEELLKQSQPIEISAEDIVSMKAQFWMLDKEVTEDRLPDHR